ncbi:hypothetical protein B0H15DRAFT_380366 [Mycena belliarum]|uniref:Uncharacterized protein n=1 Tax=Mycena belliarum TaxID=1033014 RepID=A0AAD6XT19_9AGAR|nr:hypothetical protein B0H15DRAFT_380366 [Mycena belliae]
MTDRVPASGLNLRGRAPHRQLCEIFFPALRAGSPSRARASRPTCPETTYRRPASGVCHLIEFSSRRFAPARLAGLGLLGLHAPRRRIVVPRAGLPPLACPSARAYPILSSPPPRASRPFTSRRCIAIPRAPRAHPASTHFFSSGRFAPYCPDSSETTYRRPRAGV